MNLFKCSPCKKTFSGKSQLVRHLITHTGAKPHRCGYCGNSFSRSDYLKAHIKARHTGDIPFKCKFCGKCCTSNYQLQQHTNIHTGVRPYKCSICNKSYRYKQQLLDHKNRHAGIRPWKCHIPHCEKSFVCESELKTHLNYHSGVKPYECNQCHKKFSQHCHWRAHMRTHTGIKPYACDLCPKTFSQSSHLRTHMSFHTGVKPHECSVCKERFRLPHTLKSHMRRHTGERPYKCHLCSMTFTQCSPLRHHIQKVHGDATFPCPTCGKKFPTKVQTRVHQRIHSPQEKQWFCVFCGKGWARSHDLYKHIRGHIQEKPFVCSECGEWYGSSHNKKTCPASRPPQLTLEVPPPPPMQSSSEKTISNNAVEEGKSEIEKTKKQSKATMKKKVIECKICNMVMKHQNHLNGHMYTHTKQLKKQTHFNSTVREKEQHVLLSVVPEVYNGTLPSSSAPSIQTSCPTRRPSKQALDEEVVSQTLVKVDPSTFKPLRCKICNKTMKHQNHLNGHMSIHKKRKIGKKYKFLTSRRKRSVPLAPQKQQPEPLPLLPPSSSVPTSTVTQAADDANEESLIFSKKKREPWHQNQLDGHMNIHKRAETMEKSVSQSGSLMPLVPAKCREKLVSSSFSSVPSTPVALSLTSTQQMVEAKVVNKNIPSEKVKASAEAIKAFQCKICKKVMKHQNHLNGHMNIHKKEKTKTVKKRKVHFRSRKQKKAVHYDKVLKDPLDVDLLDDADLEIEYATAEDIDYPIPSPIPIPINIEDILANDSNDVRFRSPSPEQSELRIESVRHVPVKELNKMINFRPFQCEFCNKMYKTESELERHMEIHEIGMAKKSKPSLAEEVKQTLPQSTLSMVTKSVPAKKVVKSNGGSDFGKSESKKNITGESKVINTEGKDNDGSESYFPPEILEIFDDDNDSTVYMEDSGNFNCDMPRLNAITKDIVTPTQHQRKMNLPGSEEPLLPPILVDETKANSDQLDDNPLRGKDKTILWPQRRLDNEVKNQQSGNKMIIDVPSSSTTSTKKKKSIRCSFCRRMFGNKGALAVHMKTHSKPDVHPQEQIQVELHQLQEQRRKSQMDELININQSQNEQAQQQRRQESLAKRYKCILCSFVTTVRSELSQHAQAVHYINSTRKNINFSGIQ